MAEYSVKRLKWDDLVMVEARVTRFNPTEPKSGQPQRGRRSVNENEWVARYELMAINLLHSSNKKKVTDAPIASVAI